MRPSYSVDEKGFTLVEVLAALVILGILFVGIMTIFPQMTLFNARTETKLDTMNLARQEMADITAQEKWRYVLNSSSPYPEFLTEDRIELKMDELGYSLSAAEPSHLTFTKQADYRYEADIYLECEPFKMIGEEEEMPCTENEPTKLYKVHLKLFNQSSLSSETYSYISYEAVQPENEGSTGE